MTDGHNVTPPPVDKPETEPQASDLGTAQAESVRAVAARLHGIAGRLTSRPRSPSDLRPLVRQLDEVAAAIEALLL